MITYGFDLYFPDYCDVELFKFLNTCWPFVYFLWRNVYSVPFPV